MKRKTTVRRGREALDPLDPSSWRRHLDVSVDAALASTREDLRRVRDGMAFSIKGLASLRAAAAAGVLLAIEDDALPREEQDRLHETLLQFGAALEEHCGPEGRKDWGEATARARHREKLLKDLAAAGRKDLAADLRAADAATRAVIADHRKTFADHDAWVAALVEDHRPVFRWVAFLDDGSGPSLVRLLLGLLVSWRTGLLPVPQSAGQGQPASDWIGVPLVVEVLLLPRLPAKGAMLHHHLKGLPPVPGKAASAAAMVALGITSWGSPREPLLRALAAAGIPWSPGHLGSAPPGGKDRAKALHQGQLRNARTRALKHGNFGGKEGLLLAAMDPLLRSGTVVAGKRDGNLLEVLIPGVGVLGRALP